jgi:hypothetical protein
MNSPEPIGSIPRPQFRLHSGLELLDEWAEKAGQAEKNVVYRALFSVSNGSVFRTYKTLDDYKRPQEFFVLLKEDLVMKVCIHHFEAFGILYIGSVAGAPGLDLGIDRAA